MSAKKMKKDRKEIKNEFKPLFHQKEVDGGIPLVELRTILKESKLPHLKINRFLETADQDENNLITYNEFSEPIMREDEGTSVQLSWSKRFINYAMRAVAPDRFKVVQAASEQGYDTTDGIDWGEAKKDRYADAYDCRPPPFMIPLITLSEIAVFVYYSIKQKQDSRNNVTAGIWVPLTSPLIYSPYRRIEAWRFIGYMFLHRGYVHLIFNCIMQLLLGTPLETVHKFWRVGIVYILGVLAGSLAHSCFDASKYLVGASGGCYALIGAHLATVITNWDTMQKKWLNNPINFISSGVSHLLIILLLAGFDTGFAIYNRFASDMPSQTGFSAHLGGFLAGFLIGVPVMRNLEVKKWEKIAFWICLSVYCCFMIGAILFNVFCAPKFCYETNLNYF